MDSRNLFIEIGKLFVLLGSNSFDLLIKEDNRVALAILNYNDSELIEFVRNPLMTSSEELQRVTEYGIELDSNSWIRGISISHTNSAQRFHFCYRNESVLSIAQEIFDREGITNQEFERILLIFVQATLSNLRRHNANIFVTDDAVLLKKRRWFESHFPGGVLNVMSVEEAGFSSTFSLRRKESIFLAVGLL